MSIYELVANHRLSDDKEYHIIKNDKTLHVPSIQGLILDLYKETITNLTEDIIAGHDAYREHLIAPASKPILGDILPGPIITDPNYSRFMPCFRDQRYMLYTIRPHHDYRYDTENYRRGYEDNMPLMSSARLRDEVALDYLCFNRAVEQSQINLSSKFRGFRSMDRVVYDELLETGHVPRYDLRKSSVLFYDMVKKVIDTVGVDRNKIILEIQNAE